MKQEIETDSDHATMRESFSLVQIILFIDYTDVVAAHEWENMVENLWESKKFGLFFFYNRLWRELPGVLMLHVL